MFKFRAISFPILLGIFAVIIFGGELGQWVFGVLSSIMIGMVVFELLEMLNKIEVKSFPKIAGIQGGAIAFVINLYFLDILEVECVYIVSAIMVIANFFKTLLVPEEQRGELLIRKFSSYGAIFAVLALFFPLIYCYFLEDIMISNYGAKTLLFLVLTTKMTDTGGYIAGMLSNRFMKNGNHKIFPKISPKKSYEGTIGGVTLSLIIGLVLYFVDYSPFQSVWVAILCAIIFSLGSFAGDLTESAVKRSCQIKDSGAIIPGMGGFFDVLDSFIYNGILFLIINFIIN